MARWILALAILAVSTAAPLIRWAHPAAPLAIAAVRVGLAALCLAALAGRELASLRRLDRRQRVLCGLAGGFLAAHFAVWITSLSYTSTAASLALVATQPGWAGLFAWLTLGERVDRRGLAGIVVATVGCLVLAWGDLGAAAHGALLGDLLALAGAATAAAYFVIGRGLRDALPLAPYLAAVNGVAGGLLALAAGFAGVRLGGFAGHVYLALVLCAVVPSLLGHSLLNYSVRRVPVHLVSLAILGEPIGASLISWAAFGERPPTRAVVGGAIILVGIALGFAQLPRATAR